MQRKITDILANILRPRQPGDDEERHALLQSQREMQQLEESTIEAFKNLKWTRVISMQDWEPNSTRVWDLGPDIVAELQQMAEVAAEDLEQLEPVFDPIAFQEANQNYKLERFTLPEAELHDHGIMVT